ncbi:hypothetical protein [Thermococcus barophilus]|uniref:Hypothetical membrane protein n=1 Tax=Thermococcus barophilus (strain DSM 11836 / MP) TaxID=391623 RepID=F0LIS5_THEBM|nr:hypothetical protein [Thermococcus barophilus]ADT84527.1 hypothetical membrane protein [Thermococcus barophilus MP]
MVVIIQAAVALTYISQSIANLISRYPDTAPLAVVSLLLIVLAVLAYGLFKESRHAFVLYLLVIILSLLWFSNSTQFKEKFLFFDPFFSSLVHFLLLVLLSGFIFYLAPRQSRELGFLIYGLVFASPTFREVVKSLDREFFAVFFFVITLSFVMNFSFTPRTFKAALETSLLTLFTVLSIGSNVYFSAILPAFILSFPKRHKRNYAYIGLSSIGVILLFYITGQHIFLRAPNKFHLYTIGTFGKEAFVPLILIGYLFATNFRIAIRMKGHTLFLLILSIFYLLLLTFDQTLFAPLVIIVSALSIRLTQKLYVATQT